MKNKYHVMFVYLGQIVDIVDMICEKFYVKHNKLIVNVNSKLSYIYNVEDVMNLICKEVKDEVED